MGERFRIPVTDTEAVTGVAYRSGHNSLGVTLVLGHGAGADQFSKFMVDTSEGLAARGIDTVTFNFVYTEVKRKAPDRTDKLEACWTAVIKSVRSHKKLAANRLFIGGKSMGGRIASQVAARGLEGLSGLVFLGYPLHPPGRPDQLRSAHLPSINVPMLFVQGSRDSFGTIEELKPIVDKLGGRATLFAIKFGDHSFKVPKSSGMTQRDVYETILNQIEEWVKGVADDRSRLA
jgi:predicted alpha/beta-hydrolase family hydrolase